MSIPGENILEEAFDAIDTQTISYLPYNARQLNSIGTWVTTYGSPIEVEASVQAVDRRTYVQLGLDFQKDYTYIYASINATDLDRDLTGDRFTLLDGRIYQVESQVDWFLMDGWIGALCVKVPFA